MSGGRRRPASAGRMIAKAKVPARSVAIFWLGGPTVALKSERQVVYLIDPSFRKPEGRRTVGGIDVKPDLVLSSTHRPRDLDTSSFSNLSLAFPEAQFAAVETSRDALIGRDATLDGELPLHPERVHTVEPLKAADVRGWTVRDATKLHFLPGGTDGPVGRFYNVLLNIGGLRIALVRGVEKDGDVDALFSLAPKRIDVLLWSMNVYSDGAFESVLGRLNPRWCVPIGYDASPSGPDRARQLRDAVQEAGIKAYLFPESVLEGLVYSRLMRPSRRQESTQT